MSELKKYKCEEEKITMIQDHFSDKINEELEKQTDDLKITDLFKTIEFNPTMIFPCKCGCYANLYHQPKCLKENCSYKKQTCSEYKEIRKEMMEEIESITQKCSFFCSYETYFHAVDFIDRLSKNSTFLEKILNEKTRTPILYAVLWVVEKFNDDSNIFGDKSDIRIMADNFLTTNYNIFTEFLIEQEKEILELLDYRSTSFNIFEFWKEYKAGESISEDQYQKSMDCLNRILTTESSVNFPNNYLCQIALLVSGDKIDEKKQFPDASYYAELYKK